MLLSMLVAVALGQDAGALDEQGRLDPSQEAAIQQVRSAAEAAPLSAFDGLANQVQSWDAPDALKHECLNVLKEVYGRRLAELDVTQDGGIIGDFDGGRPALRRETVVTGARGLDTRRVAGSAQLIGADELNRHEANDVHQVLRSVPGVYVREEDGFGLRPNIGLRGVNADRSAKVTLMEDGVPFAPAPYSAPEAYYFPQVTRMAAVEVYKGPASIRFGPQTVGGALNLVTRSVPSQAEGDLDVSAGNAGALKVHGSLGWGNETWGVLVEGVHLQSDGFKKLDTGGASGFAKNEFMLKARHVAEVSETVRSVVELKAGLATEQSHESYLGLSNEDFASAPQRRYAATGRDEMNWWRTQVQLSHALVVSKVLDWRVTVWRHDFDRTWFRANNFRLGPDLYTLLAFPAAGSRYRALLAGEADTENPNEAIIALSNHRTFVSQGVQSVLTAHADTGPVQHEIEFGLRFMHDGIHRDHVAHAFDMVHGTLVPDGSTPEQVADNVAFTRALAAHVTDTLSWGHLLVAPGVRFETMWLRSNDHLSGTQLASTQLMPLFGIGAVYGFDSGLSVLAGVHQGFSPVAPGQQPTVKAEQAVNSEAGLRFARAGLRAEVIGFWSEYANLTGECTGSTGCVGDQVSLQFNGGQARVLGVEAAVSVKKRVGWGVSLQGDLSYTFTSARFLSDFTSENAIWGTVSAGDELPYIPQHEGLARIWVQKGLFELGVGASAVGAQREIAGHGAIDSSVLLPTRVQVDANAAIEWGQARFYVTATNLTNQSTLVSRRPFGARPMAPFLFQVGFKYAFR